MVSFLMPAWLQEFLFIPVSLTLRMTAYESYVALYDGLWIAIVIT